MAANEGAKLEVVPFMPGPTQNVNLESFILRSEAAQYRGEFRSVLGHGRVNHAAGEYGRGRLVTSTLQWVCKYIPSGTGAVPGGGRHARDSSLSLQHRFKRSKFLSA